MRRAVILAAVATLILAGMAIKLVALSGKTEASMEVTGSTDAVMPIYDLHVRHPDIKRLPLQEIPQP